MEPTHLLYIILFLILLDFISSSVMSWINLRHAASGLPQTLSPYFDEAHYQKMMRYMKAKGKLNLISALFSTFLILIVLITGLFGILDNYLATYGLHPILHSLLFFLIIGFIADLLSIPFQAYRVFIIEENYGFNKTSITTFISDKVKSWLLAIIIGGGLLTLFILIWQWLGFWFWLPAWVLITLVSVFLTMFYARLIAPLFNKHKPLPEGDLRQRLEEFSKEAGFRLDNVFVMDGSKRSTKANAYFTGLGNRKRIVLFDTLIDKHCPEEIVAILAHEIGHYKHKHTLKNLFWGTAITGLMLVLLAIALEYPVFSQALGGSTASFHLGLLAFGFLYSPLSFLTSLLGNGLSRKFEYQADAYVRDFGKGEELKEALIKLHKDSLSLLNPHPLYVKLHYSHPPLWQRMRALGGE